MNDFSQSGCEIRSARREDVIPILEMVRELAEFEKMTDQLAATPADYEEALFGEDPAAEALVAEIDGEKIGYAIFFSTFSTVVGKAGVWLEDLYVKPSHRKLGIGKGLLKAVGEIAEKRGAGRYEWCVLDWNRNAIDLYESVGGDILDEWRIVRLDRAAIEVLPEK